MDNRKWLKRKYPESFNKVNGFLNDEQLQTFKDGKYKIGETTDVLNEGENYGKGTLTMFKRSNPVNDYNYPMHTIIVKCNDGVTASGYNSFWITPNQCKEIAK
jgi:hypothetical protein